MEDGSEAAASRSLTKISSLLAVTVEKCIHRDETKQIRVVDHHSTINELFNEIHGPNSDAAIEAKCSVGKKESRASSWNLVYVSMTDVHVEIMPLLCPIFFLIFIGIIQNKSNDKTKSCQVARSQWYCKYIVECLLVNIKVFHVLCIPVHTALWPVI